MRRLDRLAATIEDGLRTPGLKQRLEGLEHRQSALQAELAHEPPPAPRLHPNLAELYRRKVAELAQALEEPASRDEAIGLLRGLVERVELHPTDDGFDIEVTGAIAGMIALPSPGEGREIEHFVISAKRVAGARNHLKLLLETTP
jgi:hypothetical protein